jgi:glutamate-1-semialdehyde aminotransferase
MIEPVPTRRPELHDPSYLRALRQVTRDSGVLLIFDEMVTGFRSHPAGVQGLFGIEADLATYGKVIGGGLPLGVVAGRGDVLDAIDGGQWRYGDGSGPTVESTFFGGTFFQHPLSMTASRAVLEILRQRGPALQERLSQRVASFARELNDWFGREGVPIEVHAFSSFFRLVHRDNFDLLYFNLLRRGVYIWEWRCWFISDAHTGHRRPAPDLGDQPR